MPDGTSAITVVELHQKWHELPLVPSRCGERCDFDAIAGFVLEHRLMAPSGEDTHVLSAAEIDMCRQEIATANIRLGAFRWDRVLGAALDEIERARSGQSD